MEALSLGLLSSRACTRLHTRHRCRECLGWGHGGAGIPTAVFQAPFRLRTEALTSSPAPPPARCLKNLEVF